MNSITLTCALIFCSLNLACSGQATALNNNPAGELTTPQAAKADNPRTQQLQQQIEQIAADAKGRVGVMATVLESGDSVSLRADEHFPMQSVYKLFIGMATLQQVDAGKLSLAQKVRVEKSEYVRLGQHSPLRDQNPGGAEVTVDELLRLAVSESDGTASDVLMRLVGGAEVVNKYLRELKVDEIAVINTEKEIGQDWETQYRNWATPRSAVALLRALQERRTLSEQSQALLLKLLIESPTGPQRLKGSLPKEAIVAHKTGTSGSRNGVTAATNDIGLITLPNGKHLAVAVFVSDSPTDLATREGVIARIARAIYDEFAR